MPVIITLDVKIRIMSWMQLILTTTRNSDKNVWQQGVSIVNQIAVAINSIVHNFPDETS